jgi:hypothetical protein
VPPEEAAADQNPKGDFRITSATDPGSADAWPGDFLPIIPNNSSKTERIIFRCILAYQKYYFTFLTSLSHRMFGIA